ncbi:hypothetical protein RZS08_62240, partial [Arthrospira platensis SPKY1]|nr:hypothetical protein [Arthrospira platensis SPKY1]
RHQGPEHGRADLAAPHDPQHGHAAYLAHAGPVGQQAPRGQRLPQPVDGQRVDGFGIGIIEFDVGRNALLLHEHLAADAAGFLTQLVPAAGSDLEHVLPRFV